MNEPNKINYVEVPTRDIQKTQKFFEEFYGWNFKNHGPEYTSFNDGSLSGGFYKSDQVSSTASGSTLVVFYTTKLEECQKRVLELKGKVVKKIFSFPGGRRFHFTEPGGSEFAVWSDK